MYLTSHSIATIIDTKLAPTTSVSSPTWTTDNTLQLIGVVLTGLYVVFTLIIVLKTAKSVDITKASLDLARDQININRQQSQDALAASERQSQEAINAVHEQIKASEKQSQETMYNQFKPVIVPLERPILRSTDVEFMMDIENKGAGVALNTWGIFYVKNPLSAVYHFNKRYFLVPDRKETIVFHDKGDGIKIPLGEFHGYATFPAAIPGVNDRGMSSGSRLMITYNDVFDNKYLVVFDYRDELGWEQVDLKKVEPRRLDELIETKTVVI